MQFISTRGGTAVSPAQAIIQGICPRGGLYVPAFFPALDAEVLLPLAGDYRAIATEVMAPYLGLDTAAVRTLTDAAYGPQFRDDAIAPLRSIQAQQSILELWHGPTLAFKDMALQMLPHLMRWAMAETGEQNNIYILVATSGDTGKAALAGFADVEGTAVQVFYPHGGVSHAQWLQMVTQEGGNVYACGVEGNFDDAQTAVKRIFASGDINAAVREKGYRLSSANSINFGRLLPQIAYYYAAYLRLRASGSIQAGEAVNFCVPTGNFGNILAGYYAMRMGLPIKRLICASNRNNVLTDFFHTGTYNSKRPFYKSMSCSIDILVSSNLERLLFEAAGREPARVEEWTQALAGEGAYDVGAAIATELGHIFSADWCDEDATLFTIRALFDQAGYLMDPHTAVAQTVYERYIERTADTAHTVLLSTAHPFKFASDVLRAFETPGKDDFQNIERLHKLTGCAVPESIAALRQKPIRHKDVCSIAHMPQRVLEVLP